MKKIAITGSLASGKTTASKILSARRGPLFNADRVVKNIYSSKRLKHLISKKFKIKNTINLKNELRNKIFQNKKNINKLEKIIHPIVRKKMKEFITKNKKKRFIFFEIPLLIESKLMKNFDLIVFIKSNKDIRLKRFKQKGGSKKLFHILNNRQLSDNKKTKHCDHVVVNEKNKKFLKKKLLDILKYHV
tara:strand:+ start:696 stop:1262 length:567 start_codon:yes stop_codon:yes gene_type:complete